MFLICELIIIISGVSEFSVTNTGGFGGSIDLPFSDANNNILLPTIIIYITLYLCFIFMEYKTGKTPGKYIVNIKTVREQQEKITVKQALIRNLFKIFDIPASIFLFLIDKKKQRLGDLLARTYVVIDKIEEEPE
jgi:uncharacterized RDD family membrane protein YckC